MMRLRIVEGRPVERKLESSARPLGGGVTADIVQTSRKWTLLDMTHLVTVGDVRQHLATKLNSGRQVDILLMSDTSFRLDDGESSAIFRDEEQVLVLDSNPTEVTGLDVSPFRPKRLKTDHEPNDEAALSMLKGLPTVDRCTPTNANGGRASILPTVAASSSPQLAPDVSCEAALQLESATPDKSKPAVSIGLSVDSVDDSQVRTSRRKRRRNRNKNRLSATADGHTSGGEVSSSVDLHPSGGAASQERGGKSTTTVNFRVHYIDSVKMSPAVTETRFQGCLLEGKQIELKGDSCKSWLAMFDKPDIAQAEDGGDNSSWMASVVSTTTVEWSRLADCVLLTPSSLGELVDLVYV